MDGSLRIAKTVLLGLLVMMVFVLVNGEARKVDFGQLTAQVMEQMEPGEMRRGDARLLRRLYGLNGEEWENWVLYTAEDNMEVEEILLLEAKSGEQLAAAEQAAEKRAETQMKNFEGYAPEQVQLIKNRTIKTAGNYLIFVIGKDSEGARKEFMQYIYR